MAELQICLLGPFQVCWDFAPLSPAAGLRPQAARLLKLVLVRRPDPVPVPEAARLLALSPAEIAAAVDQVNKVLHPGAALQGTPEQLRFEAGQSCWIDLDAMMGHYRIGVAAAARGDMFPAIIAFQEADALYQGDLLEEVQEPWVLPVRRQLHGLYTEILERLAEGHAVLARYQDAVGFCHKALAHDPLREPTYQRMMVYYYYLGDMAGAREAYLACQETLAGAGRKPGSETVDLWGRLTRQELPSGPRADAAGAIHPGDPHSDD